jgi:prephenate dehydrogenase
LKASAITEIADSPEQLVRDCELVVLAGPPGATLGLLRSLAPLVPAGAVLTDVCSVKAPIMSQAQACGLGDRFAGAHPLSGTHETGFAAARADRFRRCVVYICETGTPAGHRAAAAVAGFWEEVLEAAPVRIEAVAHDRQLAWTSHLPQAVAFALARVLAAQGLGGVSFGSGARDTMRLAGSSPELWAELFCHNAEAVSAALAETQAVIGELRDLILRADEPGLREYFAAAQKFRQGIER